MRLPSLQDRWPFREGSFPSPRHDERLAAGLGLALGLMFTTCFVTGLYSHLAQHPPDWFRLPSRPVGLYRATQGLHVATGIAAIPLLLAKLWVVYPKLFAWPPFDGAASVVARVSLVPLVGGSLFMLFTGLANINLWYPWSFSFPVTHYWAAWITIGALIVHIAAQWSTTRRVLSRADVGTEPEMHDDVIDRRRFLATVVATSGLLTLVTVGQTVGPLRRLALLSPRRPDVGPQGFPVNRTARRAGVVEAARSPDFALVVTGRVREELVLDLAALRGMEQHSARLPIACVEGWSTSQSWTGIRVRDLLDRAGASPDASVRVDSLQRRRSYRSSQLNPWHAHDPDTLLALAVNGEPLHLDHGYPLRLIGPNRPGVMQTKWVTRLVVR
jgi:DMSO/TMAO reductase YedYZ molybdopterin-dependent catalytic subunit